MSDLRVGLAVGNHELVGVVTGVEDSVLWDVTEDIDPKTLLSCEKPNPDTPAFRVGKEDLLNKRLRINCSGRIIHRPLWALLKHQKKVLWTNFSEKLTRLRDLGQLPRIVLDPPEETPPPGMIDDDLHQFLNRIAYAHVLDLDLDAELLREFATSPRYEVYYSWWQLALDTSWLTADFIVLEHRLLPYRRSLEGKALVLEYRPGIVNVKDDDTYVPGIDHQNSHEQFVAENPDLECHSRDARNFYYETEPTERALWLAHDPSSVFNQPLQEMTVSQANLDAKACREKRFQLLAGIVHDLYEYCKQPQRWEFSSHFWYEDGSTGRVPSYQLSIDIKTLYGSAPARRVPEANVYTRFGRVPRTSELNLHGPGLAYRPGRQQENQAPAEIINSFYRRVFGIRKAWQENRESLLRSVDILKKSGKLEDLQEAARRRALAERMGVFLTQQQLHELRVLIEWLYDRFNVPAELRKPTREQYPVAESRANDLKEELRKVMAQMELVEYELLLDHNHRQRQSLRQKLQQLVWRAKQLHQQQLDLADASQLELCSAHLKLGEEIEMRELEYLTDGLEDDIRQLLDPAHKDFNCDLPMAKLVYGKAGLANRLRELQARVEQVPYQERVQHLANLLEELQARYEFFETHSETFLDDLSYRQRRQLGLEIEDEHE